jgi:hypothetical protein
MSKISVGSNSFMDEFIAALKEKSDPDKLTFFKMEGPVALYEGQAFVAKSRASRVRYSKMDMEDLISIHGEGAAETLRRMIIDEFVTEMLSELQSVTGKTAVGIYQIVSENVGMGTQGFILRYAVGPGVE